MKRRASIMLETVLVLPLFIILVFVLIQSAFVWTARQMTAYAAFCAARAALVYHPDDYAGDGGVAKRAACEVLGWISFSHKGNAPIAIPTQTGTYRLPASEGIADQVSVTVVEGNIIGQVDRHFFDRVQNLRVETLPLTDGFPSVTATVEFKYPLIVPLGGLMYVYDSKDSGVDAGTEDDSWHYLRIRESYTLPKPYSTVTFPKMPAEDKGAVGIK